MTLYVEGVQLPEVHTSVGDIDFAGWLSRVISRLRRKTKKFLT